MNKRTFMHEKRSVTNADAHAFPVKNQIATLRECWNFAREVKVKCQRQIATANLAQNLSSACLSFVFAPIVGIIIDTRDHTSALSREARAWQRP
ncbi:MAG: hypothetical protein U5N55_11745 [Cypionkella sp.]|nr:hypothetical protein [Cypionkella sp.]